jgi:hypothetical protein
MVDPEPSNDNEAVELELDINKDPDIIPSPANGNGDVEIDVLLDKFRLVPSPPKDPVNNPYDAVAVPLPDKFPDAVISARTALLPDKMTFFQFGICFSYHGW